MDRQPRNDRANVEFSTAGEIAFKALTQEDRRIVVGVIENLDRILSSEGRELEADVRLLGKGGRGTIFMVRVGEDLRMIVRTLDDALIVEDVFLRDRLRQNDWRQTKYQ